VFSRPGGEIRLFGNPPETTWRSPSPIQEPSNLTPCVGASESGFLVTNNSNPEKDDETAQNDIGNMPDFNMYSIPVPGTPLPILILKQIETSSSNSGGALYNINAEEQPENIDKGSLRVSHILPPLSPSISTNYPSSNKIGLETVPAKSFATSNNEAPKPKASLLDTVAIKDANSPVPSLDGKKVKITEAERCKLNREKRKRKVKDEEIELEELERRNKVLKSSEADLTYKIKLLQAKYLSAIKNGQFKCCSQ